MAERRYVVMGAGEVGRHVARSLAAERHDVTLIDASPEKQRLVEDDLDVRFVLGNGAHVPTLEAASVDGCDLFVAVSSSDEANLAASRLAKALGAQRCVVRVQAYEDVTRYRRIYEKQFGADLLLSTQLLTTTRILGHVLGHNTLEIEHLAGGALQVRRTVIEEGSKLAERPLAQANLPRDCLVLALIDDGRIIVPRGSDQAKVGQTALVIGTPDAVPRVERLATTHARRVGHVVIGGGGDTALSVIAALQGQVGRIKLIEIDRERAEFLAEFLPDHDIVHGDVTDVSVLASEGVDEARAFIALTGHDEANLMACLLAQELGTPHLTALVQKSETSTLWQKIALLDVVSPRTIAADRIRQYIDADFAGNIVSFDDGAAEFVQRHVFEQSPAAGAPLEAIEIPEGLIVAALMRNGAARIPRGRDRIEAGDDVILFVRRDEAELARLLFPGPEPD